jgi:hypothetical protein
VSESGEGLNSPLLTAVSRRTIAAVGVFGHMKTVTGLLCLSRDAKSIAHTTVSRVTHPTFQIKIYRTLLKTVKQFLSNYYQYVLYKMKLTYLAQNINSVGVIKTADTMNELILGYSILRYKLICHIKIVITQYTMI